MGAAFLYGTGIGSAIKTFSGTFTTDTKGGATVELGFKPDVVALTGYSYDRDCEFQMAFVFPAKATNYKSAVACYDNTYDLIDAYITQTETGFTISELRGYYEDWSSKTLTRKTCYYFAIKYT